MAAGPLFYYFAHAHSGQQGAIKTMRSVGHTGGLNDNYGTDSRFYNRRNI